MWYKFSNFSPFVQHQREICMRINEGFNDELFFELLGVANYYFQTKYYHVCV